MTSPLEYSLAVARLVSRLHDTHAYASSPILNDYMGITQMTKNKKREGDSEERRRGGEEARRRGGEEARRRGGEEARRRGGEEARRRGREKSSGEDEENGKIKERN